MMRVPTYEFWCERCGQHEEHHHPISQAPPLGSRRRCGRCGRESLVRIASVAVVNFEALQASNKYPYICRQHSNETLGGGCRETAEGHPIVESAAHEREIMARTGLVRD